MLAISLRAVPVDAGTALHLVMGVSTFILNGAHVLARSPRALSQSSISGLARTLSRLATAHGSALDPHAPNLVPSIYCCSGFSTYKVYISALWSSPCASSAPREPPRGVWKATRQLRVFASSRLRNVALLPTFLGRMRDKFVLLRPFPVPFSPTLHFGVCEADELSILAVASLMGADVVLVANGGIGSSFDEVRQIGCSVRK
eukprot:125323-Pleurochrysis_carterae.AAC.1